VGVAIENIFVIVGALPVDGSSDRKPPLRYEAGSTGGMMARRRQNLSGGDGPTLKDVRDAVVVLECVFCKRRDTFKRKVLVAQFGAGACLAKLRRRLAMGCERMVGPDGDRCQTKFPALDR
jgi:hypothetical protein